MQLRSLLEVENNDVTRMKNKTKTQHTLTTRASEKLHNLTNKTHGNK